MQELPFGSEFSPSQIYLPDVLEICKNNNGNKESIEKCILEKYFSEHGHGNEANKKKLAMNCRIGLKCYGIIDENCSMTKFGNELYEIRLDNKRLHDTFAKHILLNLNGMSFIQCIREMTLSLEKVTLQTLRPALEIRGITYPSGGKHPSIMRLWLEKAGVFTKQWNLNNERINEILGCSDDIESLKMLSKEQRYFLLALLNTGVDDFQPASQVVRLASTTYGVSYPEKSLPKLILNKLEEVGYIDIEKATAGRGAKSHRCKPTKKAKTDVLKPFLKQLEEQTDPKLIKLLTKSLPDILNDIESTDTYVSGLALETLSFKLLRILGLDYMATRLRAEATGGSEVDLIFESSRLVYSRWQVQCKNTSHVSLDQVAKEVGLTQMLYSNVIVIITTGIISGDAKKFANHVMKNTNLDIVFIEGDDLKNISQNPPIIADIFDRKAKNIMKLKKIDI